MTLPFHKYQSHSTRILDNSASWRSSLCVWHKLCCLLLVCCCLHHPLPVHTRAVAELAVSRKLLAATPPSPTQGFLSIDCGYTGAAYSSDRKIWWQADAYFDSGLATATYNGLPAESMEGSLRVFKAEQRGCYSLPLKAAGRYLVRVTLIYYNYDAKQLPPTITISIQSTGILTLALDEVSFFNPDFILNTQEPNLTICFIREDPTRDAIVNGLEVRPLPSTIYPLPASNNSRFSPGSIGVDANPITLTSSSSVDSSFLLRWLRLTCGGSIFLNQWRYPDDPLDRLWLPDESALQSASGFQILPLNTSSHSTTAAISGLHLLPSAAPPEFIFRSIRTTHEPLSSLQFVFFSLSTATYQLYLYFSSVWPADLSQGDLVFDIILSNQLVRANFDLFLECNSQRNSSAVVRVDLRVTAVADALLELRPSSSSRLKRAAISGLELLMEVPAVATTAEEEVAALLALRAALDVSGKLRSWKQDPCSPVEWEGVTCGKQRQIVSLDLSGLSLSGSIPTAIAALTSLTKLNMSFNKLQGAMPASFASLSSLSELDVAHNELQGSFPASLARLSSLSYLDITSNNFSGDAIIIQNITVVKLANNTLLCSTSQLLNLPLCNLTLIPPLPSPSSPPPPSFSPSPSSSPSTTTTIIIIIIAVLAAAVTAGIISFVFFCIYKKRISKDAAAANGATSAGDKAVRAPLVAESYAAKLAAGSGVVQFSLLEMQEATHHFSDAHLIGAGGFGPVFKGVLQDGQVVAIKRRDTHSLQGEKEFFNEVEHMSRISHPHLVSLLGFCHEGGDQILVYEFMSRGTLRDHLYDSFGQPLGALRWITRLSVAVGAAKGLEYLHSSLKPSIIHRDVKTSNILLDESFVAKVADFGLSRVGPEERSHVSTNVKGTVGYMDPEYFTVMQLTEKSDVFSFGVVLLEIISGRQPINMDLPRHEWSIIDWARGHLEQGRIEALIDPTLISGEYLLDAFWKVAEVGIICVEPMGVNRPSMSDVVKELTEALEMEISAAASRAAGDSNVTFSESGSEGQGMAMVKKTENSDVATEGSSER